VVFGVLATTFCPSAIRNALSASGAVRVRDVMFNVDNRGGDASPTFIGVVVVAVIAFKLFMLFFSSSESAVERATRKYMENPTGAAIK
jgi:hypothetical protein